MCRLLAIKNKINDKDLKIVSNAFRKQSQFGKVPKGSNKGHKDGWGFVTYNLGKVALFKRSYNDAYSDNGYKIVENKILEESRDIIIGHLRKSSIGKSSINNSHPFVYKNFSFCQNGTIFNSERIRLKSKYKKLIKGDTDSERLFYFILGEVEEKMTKSQIEKAIKKIRKGFDYTAMNILLSDGKKLFVLRDINLNNKEVKKLKMKDYYSLFIGINKKEKYTIIASEKIEINGVNWQQMKNEEFIEIN